MNKFKLKAMLFAGIVAATPLSWADDVGGFTLILPNVGLYDFDNNRGLDSEAVYQSGGIGYQFNNHWALEAIYARIETESDNQMNSGLPEGRDVDFDQYHLDALYTLNPEDKLQGYFVAGAGYGEFEADGVDDTVDDTFINYGVGVKYAFTDRFAFRGDVRGFTGVDEEDTDAAVTLALNWLFAETRRVRDDTDGDGVNDKIDQCPGTPAGVQVDANGCPLDADGDGVADNDDKCPNTPTGVEVNAEGCALDDDGDGVVNNEDNCHDTRAGAKVDATGCYVMVEEKVEIRLDVEFDLNSAAARDEHRAEVAKLAEFMRQYPQTQVEVEGHSDSSGAATYNQQLSERRAATIARMLVDEFGIDQSRVRSVGYGEDRPITDNNTAAGRQENRRVVAAVTAIEERHAE